MLRVDNLDVFHGDAQALDDVSLEIGEGAVVAIVGANGAGKTSLIRAIAGMHRPARGRIAFRDIEIGGWESHRVCNLGIGQVAEGRQVFPTLSVEENLIATSAARFAGPRWTLERVYDFFPQLAERRRHVGNELSGGEQQMLAIGRALMTNPKLLILDEATEGLAPLLRQDIWQCLGRLKAEGQAILLVDKHLGALMKLADRHTIIEKGQVVWSGTSAALEADRSIVQRYLQI